MMGHYHQTLQVMEDMVSYFVHKTESEMVSESFNTLFLPVTCNCG